MRWLIIILTLILVTARAAAQDMPLSQILIDGEGWKMVKGNYDEIERLYESFVTPTGSVAVFHKKGRDEIWPDGRVVNSYRVAKPEHLVHTQYAHGGFSAGLSVFSVDPESRGIGVSPCISKLQGRSYVVSGLTRPSGITTSPDESTLFVGDAGGSYVWAFRIERSFNLEAAELSAGQPYGLLRTKPNEPSGVRWLEADSNGRIYALTNLGVQILDPTGRLCGVLTNPTREPLVGMSFGGEKGHLLYVASKTTVYVRKLKSQRLGFSEPE
jgi:hypothetical protein